MNVVFSSILKDEIASFIEFVKLSVVDYKAYQRTLYDFDSFLHSEELAEKKLDARQIERWLDGFDIHPLTKKSKLTHVRKFAGYLSALGIDTSVPELPRTHSDFVPYVFSSDEMARIFEAADDLMLTNPRSRTAAELPMLLRILYGCGLRYGEATSLTWNDIDLSSGVITIKNAKNNKQRLIPMDEELTRILKLYRTSPCCEADDSSLLFKTNDGKPRTSGTYRDPFNGILCDLRIINPQTKKNGSRGPCIHSLRHTFTMQSLIKAETEGKSFLETVPFLSTYLGHAGLMETDKYLKVRHELYTESHATIADYISDVLPDDVLSGEDM